MSANRSKLPSVQLDLRIRGLPQSATLAINEVSARLVAEGRSVYRFGLGQSPFPVPQPVVEALQANAHQNAYLAVSGLAELRESIAGYLRRKAQVDRSPDDVLVGPGSKELMFLLQLAYYGDLVIPTPTWVSYAPQANVLGRQIRWVPTHAEHGWLMMPEELDRLCASDPDRPRIVILNYPSNPTGGTYTGDQLRALARVARRFKVVLLSDEIYGELHHRGRHVSIARYYPEGTIVSTGLSKWCGAGGWRLGTFVFPRSLRWLLEGMAAVASETYTSTSAPIQYAAVRAFGGGAEIEAYLQQARKILRAIRRELIKRLGNAGISATEPKGAFYLFLEFTRFRERLAARAITDSQRMCTALLEATGVALLPGSVFGRPPEELTARLAYVDFDGAGAMAALSNGSTENGTNSGFLDLYCGKLLEGVDRLCAWVTGE